MDLMFAQLDALAQPTPAPYSSPYSPVAATADAELNDAELNGLSTSPSAYHEWWLHEGQRQLKSSATEFTSLEGTEPFISPVAVPSESTASPYNTAATSPYSTPSPYSAPSPFTMEQHQYPPPHMTYYAPSSSSSSTSEEHNSYQHYAPPPAHSYPFSAAPYTTPFPGTNSLHTQPPTPGFSSTIPPYDSTYTAQEAELKRLRNTAASARFRAKKKQREANLEQSAKEKREQLQKMEERIKQLEKENQWLRELILRKGEVEKEKEEEGKRKGDEKKKGVGTEEEK
ncbi:hypothetical protein BP5796_11639 [Coleophoma crateriformis]|uniref:BZIP domain-containing protein n=1 Tax=Coleophoma crateriformis TaxID=565419 RepID=A0A3D8QDW4_9HELO|nr:hypothetical protein BP5796_11639 [Coleophoma crateriformis]